MGSERQRHIWNWTWQGMWGITRGTPTGISAQITNREKAELLNNIFALVFTIIFFNLLNRFTSRQELGEDQVHGNMRSLNVCESTGLDRVHHIALESWNGLSSFSTRLLKAPCSLVLFACLGWSLDFFLFVSGHKQRSRWALDTAFANPHL